MKQNVARMRIDVAEPAAQGVERTVRAGLRGEACVLTGRGEGIEGCTAGAPDDRVFVRAAGDTGASA